MTGGPGKFSPSCYDESTAPQRHNSAHWHIAPASSDPHIGAGQMTVPMSRLRASFPQFWIWQEITYDRPRYIARSRHPGVGPHTVITTDPDELRAALAT